MIGVCPDCPANYCHAHGSQDNKHVMSFLYPNDHSGLKISWENYYFYCARCLSPLIRPEGSKEWIASKVVIEWP